MSSTAAKRYAKALFEIADEKDLVEKISDDLQAFSSMLKQQELLRSLFFSVDVQAPTKQHLLQELLARKTPPFFLNFLKVLVQKLRESLFQQIIKEYHSLYDKKLNRVSATVVTAIPLKETTKSHIISILSDAFKATVLLESRIDADILGGFVLYMEGNILDASLRRKLEELKMQLHRSDAA